VCSLASPGQAGYDEAMSPGARRECEWSTKIRPKALQVHGFIFSFIFVMSSCLIHFDRDRPSRLLDVVILGSYSL
jgi:hypothetical protein